MLLLALKHKAKSFLFPPKQFYNITASTKYAYTWFRVAKCGTRTFLSALEQTQPEINSNTVEYKAREHAQNFKFCVIRNPWDRILSTYCDKVQQKKLFPACWGRDFFYFLDFVAEQNLDTCNPHIRRQKKLFPVKDIDFIGRFEAFEDTFNFIIREKIGLKQPLLHKNQSQHQHYSIYYNSEYQEKVAELYSEDIQLGNYFFEPEAH